MLQRTSKSKPKTIMSVQYHRSCAAKSKLDQITSHYGLTEDDLINTNYHRINKTDFEIELDNDYSRPLNVINPAVHHHTCKTINGCNHGIQSLLKPS